MSDLSVIIIVFVSLVAVPVDLVVFVHLVTAVVSSELRSQRGGEPDVHRTVMWCTIWVMVAVVAVVVVGVASTL
jgi:hypothetical protein